MVTRANSRQGTSGAWQRARGRRYEELPEFLPGATEFTDDPQLNDPVWLVRALRRHPDIVDELLAATDLSKRRGRKRLPGDWALVMIAMVASGEVDVERFCNRYASSAIWTEAGFSRMPTVQTVWNRLTELEPHAEAFVAAADKLIQRAVRHEPRFGRNVWLDATGFETHAALIHCCEDTRACRASGDRYGNLVRAPGETIEGERHAEAAKAEEDALEPEHVSEDASTPSKAKSHSPQGRPYRDLTITGKSGFTHRFRTLDPDAGARMYDGAGQRKRFWFGGYIQTGIDVFIGAPLAHHVMPANRQEFKEYPAAFDKVRRATGRSPESAVLDRGYSFRKVFKFNTKRGVATVSPWRKPSKNAKR